MRILLISYRFDPGIGGVESVSWLLALEFFRAGYEVTLVTHAEAAEGPNDFPCRVIRRPNALRLCWEIASCDVVLQNNLDLKYGWPLFFGLKKWIVAHHIAPDYTTIAGRIKSKLKTAAAVCATRNIAVSTALAQELPFSVIVIPNPYDANIFRKLCRSPVEEVELIFVGRLVAEKGLNFLLNALPDLQQPIRVRLTVVGDGPARPHFVKLTSEKGLEGLVNFLGFVTGDALAGLLNRHRVLVAPSHESFGIVALEAMACGCLVVGSCYGGLSEAIGPGGFTCDPSDPAFIDVIAKALESVPNTDQEAKIAAHLAKHKPDEVARRYLDVMSNI